ncbi:DUF4365 domain-containing protein [Rhizobium leguminosarum]|uniref:DUF4365 domain-containing protein n=1 Tax=Rhizobium leguminosarum TaxID=384 RepID=UPI001031E77D|nr:DUF4365 domain-containing protein [Rhizobium leguminosarum]TBG25399.1 DUF4365 domain-containing protein [Rhizobium leguminosarum]
MPLRPDSHRVAEAAVQKFEALKPREWICRAKSSDYGVDLEVEIFTPDGRDTGLTFNVQSKGTAKEKLEKSVPISFETLKYLCKFDVPAIIFRHSEATGNSYWMWADEALAKAAPRAKKVAIKFSQSNLWNASTPARLETSVRYRRMIKERERLTRFPICFEATSAEKEIEFSAISGDLTASVPFLDAHRGRDGIQISVEMTPSSIAVAVADIAVLKENVPSLDNGARTAALAYLVLKLFVDLRFDAHAERVADFCLRRELPAPSRLLATDASMTLLDNPKSAVDLALLNELHKPSDWLALLFASILRSNSDTFGRSSDPVVRFYRAMINAKKTGEDDASLRYTLGNYLRSKRAYPGAVREYNAARKADPTYMERSYFLKELGGLLFMWRRFRCAAKAYERLVSQEDTPSARLLYGDALIYSGNPLAAKPVYAVAAEEASSTGAEAYLKIGLSGWLLESGASATDHAVLVAVRQREQERENAAGVFWAHLAITFLFEDDVECWADAIFLSFHKSELYLEAVLLCALKRCGVAAFLLMKSRRTALLVADPSILATLEELVAASIAAIRQESTYVPGLISGEIDKLYEERGIIRMERDLRF